MLNINERLMVEEFDNTFPNRAQLSVALINSPTVKFRTPLRVTEFTPNDKITYIRERRTREYLQASRKVVDDSDITSWLRDQEDEYTLTIMEVISGLR